MSQAQAQVGITESELRADQQVMDRIVEVARLQDDPENRYVCDPDDVLSEVLEILTSNVGVGIDTAIDVVKNDVLREFSPEFAAYKFGAGRSDADRAMRLKIFLENLEKPQARAAELVDGVRPYYRNLYDDEQVKGSTTPIMKAFFAGGCWPPSEKPQKAGAVRHMGLTDIKKHLNRDHVEYRKDFERYREYHDHINRCSFHFSTFSTEARLEEKKRRDDELERALTDGTPDQKAAAEAEKAKTALEKQLGTVSRAAKTLKTALADTTTPYLDKAAFVRELKQDPARATLAEVIVALAEILPVAEMVADIRPQTIVKKKEGVEDAKNSSSEG